MDDLLRHTINASKQQKLNKPHFSTNKGHVYYFLNHLNIKNIKPWLFMRFSWETQDIQHQLLY